MKPFLEYLTELFDRPLDFRLWNTTGNVYIFSYFLFKGKVYSLSKVSGESDKLMRSLGISEDDTLPGVIYSVSFTPVSKTHPEIVNALQSIPDFPLSSSDIAKCYEMGFGRRDGVLKKEKPRGSPMRKTWRVVVTGAEETDDDLSRLSSPETISVFSTVVGIAKSFVSSHNPLGIVYGTKRGANPARTRIYDAISKRTGGRVISIPNQKNSSLNNIRLVWLK